MLRDDRDVEAVEVELLVAGLAGEREDDVFPTTSVLFSPVSAQSGCCGCVAIFARSKLYFTSVGVIALPSLHFTPRRIVMT